MNKWIAEFDLEDGDTMPEHMDLNYMGAQIDFHCRPMWIPCKERLPDKSGEYYTTYEIKDKKYMGSRFFDAEYSLFSGASLVTVLAWMPLPEPYKEEGDEK